MNKRIAKDQDKQKELMLFLGVVWRRWSFFAIVSGLVLAVAASAVAIKTFKPQYDAKIYFQIIQNPDWIELAKGLGGQQNAANVLSMFRSEVICNRVVIDPEISRVRDLERSVDKAKALQQRVTIVSAGKNSELYSLTVLSSVPTDSALLTQKVWDKFVEEQDHFRVRQSDLLQLALSSEVTKVEERLKTLGTDLQALHNQMTKTEGVAPKGDDTPNRLTELEKQQDDNQLAIEAAERDLLRFKENPEETDWPDEEIQMEVNALPSVVSAEAKLRDVQFQEQETQFGPTHPKKKSIDFLLNQAKEELRTAKINGENQIRLKKRREAKELNEKEEEALIRARDELVHQAAFIQTEIKEELDKIKSYKESQFIYERKQEDERKERADLASLKDRLQQVRLRELSPFNVIRSYITSPNEPVAVPLEPIEQYPVTLILLLSGLGLGLPFLAAIAWEFRVRRVSSPDQMKPNVALIGEIADLPTRFNRSGRVNQQVQVFQESVDSISTYLRTSSNGHFIRSLAIASAVTNEGKTTVSTQLAVSLARTSAGRVLLIDCDLRAPTIHRVFEIDREPGVVSVLNGTLELSDAVVESHVENLDVLPAGILRENPHRLIGQNKLAQLIRQAEKQYEVVILDTPPVLSASEALVVAKEADGTLMCVMRDVSRVDVTNRACQKMIDSKVTILGYVFSGVPQSAYAY